MKGESARLSSSASNNEGDMRSTSGERTTEEGSAVMGNGREEVE